MNAPPQNVADQGAHVNQQIGVNHGSTTFHSDKTIYNIHEGDSPDRKFEAALGNLDGSMPRDAEELFGELVRNGHASTRLLYYYGLSMLSGRTLNEVTGPLAGKFSELFARAQNFPVDEWRRAHQVVGQLMSGMWQQANTGHPAKGVLQTLTTMLTSLPAERQVEINRHLNMVLGGAIQDHLDAVDVDRVISARMDHGRVSRAWKFFEPDPAPPRMPATLATTLDGLTWLRAAVGVTLTLWGLWLLLGGFTELGVLLAALLLAGGGYLAVRYGLERTQLAVRVDRLEDQFGRELQEPVSPGHWVSTSFVKDIHSRVDVAFRNARPHRAGSWEVDTRGLREHLKTRFVQLFGNAKVTPAQVNWLIRWHANQAAARWRQETLFAHRTLRPSTQTTLLCFAGVALVAGGLAVLIANGAIGTAIVMGAAAYLTATGVIPVLAVKADDREAKIEDEALFAQEKQAHAELVERLFDRPTDGEMARWLDLDKSFLKTAALNRCGLRNRDLVAHVVMTQGAPGAMRARYVNGPVRHSEYIVLVFLLTKGGVREVEVMLDFLNGATHNEKRKNFKYDSLTMADVTETGVSVANTRRLDTDADGMPGPLENRRLRKRAFCLTLASGDNITVAVEDFSGFSDIETESEARLSRIALQTSGIASAIQILENVAAEGSNWINEENERRKQRWEDWRENNPERDLSGSAFRALLAGDD